MQYPRVEILINYTSRTQEKYVEKINIKMSLFSDSSGIY